MRIILTSNFSPWSAYRADGPHSAHQLGSALAGRGHDVTVVYTRTPFEDIEAPEVPYRLRWAFLPDLKSRRRAPLRPLTALSIAWVVREELARSSEKSVVHSQGEESAALGLLRQAIRNGGMPVDREIRQGTSGPATKVMRLAGQRLLNPLWNTAALSFRLVVTPRFPSVPEMVASAVKPSVLERLSFALGDTKYLTLGVALRGADVCCPPSDFAAGLFKRSYGLHRVRAIHDGVSEEYLRTAWSPDAHRARVTFVGPLEHQKGVDVLLRAVDRLGTVRPRVTLVGSGHYNLQPLAQELGLESRLEVLDWRSHDQVAKVIRDSSMVVLPSREESFSRSILSAMAVGAPVVTTRVGGTDEVIHDGVNGMLVDPEDVVALSEGMAELFESPELGERLGRRARETVRERFTMDATADAFEAVYAELLGMPTPARTTGTAVPAPLHY